LRQDKIQMEAATRPCQVATMVEKERIHRGVTSSCISRRQRKRPQKKRGCFSAASTVIAIIFFVPCFCDTQQLTLSLAVAAASSTVGNETHSDSVPVQDSLVGSLLKTPMFHNNTSTSTSSSSIPLVKKKTSQHQRTMQEEMKLQAQQEHSQVPKDESLNPQLQVPKDESLNPQDQAEYQQYMEWCLTVLGIQTSLEIHTFMYYDYMSATMTHPVDYEFNNNDDDDDFETELISNSTQHEQWQDPPMIPVRGLRATRNISHGEIIISIPFQALLTVSNTIDQDPVLSRVMGPQARKAYGWTLEQDTSETTDHHNNNNNHDATNNIDFFELPLLAMALLHHYKLGTSSPMYPYIHLLRKSPLDAMPFLWGKKKRQEQYGRNPTSSVSKGIQTVARSIRLEMKDMYHTVVDTLLLHHPDLFGRRNANTPSSSPNLEYDVLDEEEWAFSFENFQWAFAMVNSRHWLLPIVDLDPLSQEQPPQPVTPNMMQPQRSLDGVPPAEMPTDAWVDGETEQEDNGAPTSTQQPREPKPNSVKPKATSYHSFLAPVADLLNFGPPCTRGRYNQETHTFDIIASCTFIPGQEVTFWYSDECEDIVMGNYGFTHPMVPKCPTAEDYKLARDKWRQRATNLQTALEDAYEDMDVMDTELQHVQQILANCDCCDTTARPRPPHSQHEPQQPQAAAPKEQILAKPFYGQQQRQPEGTLDDRNQQDPAPSQIRGGGGNRMSRSNTNGGSNVGTRPTRSSHGSRSRRKRAPTDDDVERHGVRRMWAGRSGL
jgi:SET domain